MTSFRNDTNTSRILFVRVLCGRVTLFTRKDCKGPTGFRIHEGRVARLVVTGGIEGQEVGPRHS